MSKKFGFELLEQQASEAAAERAAERVSQGAFCRNDPEYRIWGDSEIEKLLFLALLEVADGRTREQTGLIQIDDVSALPSPEGSKSLLSIYIRRQVPLEEGWRADFVVYASDPLCRVLKKPGWRELVIECDGHDFHERTKEQAARDRSRDRAVTLNRRTIMRFTGSELWRDPMGCALEVYDWAVDSFP